MLLVKFYIFVSRAWHFFMKLKYEYWKLTYKLWFIVKGTASISRELTERLHIAVVIVKQSSVVWTAPLFGHPVHFPVLWLCTQLLTKQKPNSLCPMKRMFSLTFLLLLKLKKIWTISILPYLCKCCLLFLESELFWIVGEASSQAWPKLSPVQLLLSLLSI